MGGRWTAARWLAALFVLTVLVWRLGTAPFLTGLRGLRPGTVLAAAAIGAGTTVCSAWRWRAVAEGLGAGLPLRGAVAAYYRSQFLNSALPGGVLGDVHRGLRHGIDGGDPARGLRAVVWERGAGQVVQAAVAVAVLLVLPSPVRAATPAVIAGAAAVVGVVLVAGRGVARWGPARPARAVRATAAEIRVALLRPPTLTRVLLASLLVVGGHVGMFLLAARAVGVTASPLQLLPLALVVLVAAAVPLNIGGWGPREGAAAWVFAAAGAGAPAGAAVATAFGVLTLVSVLPGALVLLAGSPVRQCEEAPRPRVREDGVVHV